MPQNKKKILLVDDNKTIVMYVSMLLKRMGFEVIPAENGLEALKLFKLTGPDLVIIDITMPIMDGLTVLRLLKEDKSTAKIPVIMLSIDSDKELIDQCREIGSSGFLTKPLQLESLHELLQSCFLETSGFRRKHLRSPYHEKVAVKYKGETFTLYAESISEGGIFIRKRDPFDVGSDVEVIFPLRNVGSFSVKGAVIYTKQSVSDLYNTSLGMAVKFEGLTADDSLKLSILLIELLAGDILATQEEVVIQANIPDAEEQGK